MLSLTNDLPLGFEAITQASGTSAHLVATSRNDLDYLIVRTINVMLDLFNQGYAVVVSSSYGKDSSVTLALTLEAARRYKHNTGRVPVVRVVTSDTRVENPLLSALITKMSSEATAFGVQHGLDVKQYFAQPMLLSRALVSTLGGRTIFSGPGTNAKCQQDLKAAPLKRMASIIRREFKERKLCTATGTRFSESSARSEKMKQRQERYDRPWKNKHDNDTWFISPIADWEDRHVFEFMDRATADMLGWKPFNNMVSLVALYELTGLDVCPTSMGSAMAEASCGGNVGRFGCFTCQKVSKDHSMARILDTHPYLSPLQTLNELIRSGLNVPHHRAWIGRSIDADGYTLVSPISHSYRWCHTLLWAVLSIDANEDDWASQNNKERRFGRIMTREELVAIGFQWGRYFGRPWSEAVNLWNSTYDLPNSRMSEAQMQQTILENRQASVPLNQLKKAGRFRMYPEGYDAPPEPGMIDGVGECVGIYGSGAGVVDSKGRLHSPLAEASSFTVEFGDEPDLAWYWISQIAAENNDDDACFLTRSGYIKFKPGYYSTMARMVEYMRRVRELGLGPVLDNISSIMKREEFMPLP